MRLATWASGCSRFLASALVSCLQDSFRSSSCSYSDSNALVQGERELTKEEEEETGQERRKLDGPVMGLFVSLLSSRTRIITSALLGVSLITDGVWSHLWYSLWGLQGVTLLYWSCSDKDPQGSYVGTRSGCFTCTQCLSTFLGPYTALCHGKGQHHSHQWGTRKSKSTRLKQSLESLKFLGRQEKYPKTGGGKLLQFLKGRKE